MRIPRSRAAHRNHGAILEDTLEYDTYFIQGTTYTRMVFRGVEVKEGLHL